jgi:hypothetical protein
MIMMTKNQGKLFNIPGCSLEEKVRIDLFLENIEYAMLIHWGYSIRARQAGPYSCRVYIKHEEDMMAFMLAFKYKPYRPIGKQEEDMMACVMEFKYLLPPDR